MDRNEITHNMLMFIRMSSNGFYLFSTVYPGSGYKRGVARPLPVFLYSTSIGIIGWLT